MKLVQSVLGILLLTVFFSSCGDDDTTIDLPEETTTFTVTLTNKIDILATQVFNTPEGAAMPGPIANQGGSYVIDFKAFPGSKLNFASMLANSNDWFFAFGQDGIDLYDENGNPKTGDMTASVRLYDAGTEEEDPATIATVPDGGTNGSPDDDNTVRTQQEEVANYLTATLSHNNGTFTLRLTKEEDGILTPGLIVVHAQSAPLFTRGEADRGNGLKLIAEAGDPSELNDYFNATGSTGAPLRLSTAHTPFSPGVVYAFEGDKDPLFTQGEAALAESGLEQLAEDGDNQVIFDYLSGLGLPVAKSNEPGGIGPNGSLTFDIAVPAGYKLGIATMFVQSNDWFIAFNNNGVALFDAAGDAVSGMEESEQLYLYDAGTEADEAVGFGTNQALRQAGPNTGSADTDNTVRRVGEIEDEQFGKGTISSSAGVVYFKDDRGGYNLLEIDIQAN
ncbi:MAG: spondin domain-containing protein [Bacteroidota bacterium]